MSQLSNEADSAPVIVKCPKCGEQTKLRGYHLTTHTIIDWCDACGTPITHNPRTGETTEGNPLGPLP